MPRSNFLYRALAACGLAILTSAAARASISTADSVLQYSPGDNVPDSYWGEPYSDFHATAPLGLPDVSENLAENDSQGIYPDDSIVGPFNGQYNPANITAIGGAGGYIELHMSQPIATNGYTLGIHTGAGLNDSTAFTTGSGVNTNPATNYTNPRSATVSVSQDGVTFYPVTSAAGFNNPTNIYTDIDAPYTTNPGSNLAHFGQPFVSDLAVFNGLDFADTISALNGSAGGTWVDLAGLPISQVNYVSFQTVEGQTMYLDSIVGLPIPEPAAIGLLVIPILALKRNR